jgi:hypothetical protein
MDDGRRIHLSLSLIHYNFQNSCNSLLPANLSAVPKEAQLVMAEKKFKENLSLTEGL